MNQSDNALEMIQQLAKQMLENESRLFTAQQLATRFENLPSELRYDHVVRNIGGIFEKAAQRDPHKVITAEQVGQLYEELVRLNPETQFKAHFSDLLPVSLEKVADGETEIRMRDNFYEDGARGLATINDTKHDISETDDEMMAVPGANIIEDFEPEMVGVARYHGPETISQGAQLVATELQVLGEKPRTQFKYSSRNGLLFLARLETPTGSEHIHVPIEVRAGQVLFPTMFIASDNVYNLTRSGIDQFKDDATEARRAKQEAQVEATRHTLFADTVREPGEQAIEVDELEDLGEYRPKVELGMPEVEAILENAVLRKESSFSDSTIDQATELVRTELANLSYRHAQIRFAGDHAPSSVLFDAVVQHGAVKHEIVVPVQVRADQILMPSKFSAKADREATYDFSKEGFEKFAQQHAGEGIEVRYSGLILDQDYNTLRKIIHQATFDRKHAVAREALNCIQDKFGPDTYNAALADYQEWLTQASQDYSKRCTGCPYYMSHTRRGSTSVEDRCGLLHIACRKVVKDEETGICHKSTFDWDRLRDDAYKGTITTSQISFT